MLPTLDARLSGGNIRTSPPRLNVLDALAEPLLFLDRFDFFFDVRASGPGAFVVNRRCVFPWLLVNDIVLVARGSRFLSPFVPKEGTLVP